MTCKINNALIYYEDLREKQSNNLHWTYCERNKLPYISIRNYNHKYDNIFYDITNLPYDLSSISESVKSLYFAYLDFFMVPLMDIEELLDDYYFFNLYTKKEHTEYFSKQLFIYLKNKQVT